LFVLGWVAALPELALASEDPLIMGIFPRRNAVDTVRMFTPLAQYLSRRLGREVRVVTSKDFESFWQGVIQRRYDIVHYNQLHYIKSHDQAGYRVILKNEEFGESTIASTILVRADAGIRALPELRGKTIMFGGDRSAMMSYVVPTALLRRAGLSAGDYIEEFAKNPPNALLGSYFGQAAASAVGDVVIRLPRVVEAIDPSTMLVLAKSEPIAHLPWAVKGSMTPRLAKRIQEILAALAGSREGRRVLHHTKLTRLLPATDSEYDICRRLIDEVAGEGR